MGLVRKGTSEATLKANQANAARSRGATSERGRQVSSRNAIKHWGRAEAMRDFLPALGEDAAEFEDLRRGLYQSLEPGDDFEHLLVDDMADIHWRQRRMIRAETAKQALHRCEQKAKAEEREAKAESLKFHELEPSVAAKLGYAGLTDSPAKFFHVIELLKAIGELVQKEGFPGEGVAYLKGIYGCEPGVRPMVLIDQYERSHDEAASADATTDQAHRDTFLKTLDEEIAWFEERAESHRQARADLKAPRAEAGLLHEDFDPAKVVAYQERLERCFERKWKLLRKYRATRRAAERREASTCAQRSQRISNQDAPGPNEAEAD